MSDESALNRWEALTAELEAAQQRVAVLEAALRGILECVDKDCGDPTCEDCEPWRDARAAIASTEPTERMG